MAVIWNRTGPQSRSVQEHRRVLARYGLYLEMLDKCCIMDMPLINFSKLKLHRCGFLTLGDAVRGWDGFMRAKYVGKATYTDVLACLDEQISPRESWYAML